MTNIYVNKLEVISQHKLRSTSIGLSATAAAAAAEALQLAPAVDSARVTV